MPENENTMDEHVKCLGNGTKKKREEYYTDPKRYFEIACEVNVSKELRWKLNGWNGTENDIETELFIRLLKVMMMIIISSPFSHSSLAALSQSIIYSVFGYQLFHDLNLKSFSNLLKQFRVLQTTIIIIMTIGPILKTFPFSGIIFWAAVVESIWSIWFSKFNFEQYNNSSTKRKKESIHRWIGNILKKFHCVSIRGWIRATIFN